MVLNELRASMGLSGEWGWKVVGGWVQCGDGSIIFFLLEEHLYCWVS